MQEFQIDAALLFGIRSEDVGCISLDATTKCCHGLGGRTAKEDVRYGFHVFDLPLQEALDAVLAAVGQKIEP